MSSRAFLGEILRYLREDVAPNAQQMDGDPETLRPAIEGLFRLGAMNLKAPTEFGGPNLSDLDFREFQEEVARTSGSLSFLQTQHQSAVSFILKGHNEQLKSDVVPKMRFGERRIGVGFSQLRRPGPPIMRATPTEGGYRLDGTVPWITGWTFFDEFLIGATLPDGKVLFGIVPLSGQAGINISAPMQVATMYAARTVSAELDGFLLDNALLVGVQSGDFIRRNDQINVVIQGHFALGCARGALDVLEASSRKRENQTAVKEAYEALFLEWTDCRQAMFDSQGEELTQEARVQLRAWAIELCARCAHAAVTSSAGGAIAANHPAQRILREAMVYTVSAQTQEIMDATLSRLSYRRVEV